MKLVKPLLSIERFRKINIARQESETQLKPDGVIYLSIYGAKKNGDKVNVTVSLIISYQYKGRDSLSSYYPATIQLQAFSPI